MEFNDLMVVIDGMETIAIILGTIFFVSGVVLGVLEQRLIPVGVGIFMGCFFGYAPDIVMALLVPNTPEHALDAKEVEEGGFLSFLILVPIIGIIFNFIVMRLREESLQPSGDNSTENSINSTTHPEEPPPLELPATEQQAIPQEPKLVHTPGLRKIIKD